MLCTPSQTIEWPEDFNVVRMTLKKDKESKQEDIRLKFITGAENVPNLLKVMETKAI